MFTRRTLLAGGLTALAACTRKKARGFSGYAFIANQEGGAIAAVDLEVFAVARHIRVDGAPTAVVARRNRAFALTPANGTVHEIRTGNLTLFGKLQVAHSAILMHLAPDRPTLYVLCSDPKQLVALSLDPMSVDWTLPLPNMPADLDVSADGASIAISYSDARAISFLDVTRRRVFPPVDAPGEIGLVRFQAQDSQKLIAANLNERMLAIYQVPARKLMVNLPLAVRPDHLCFKPDGGELYVTGQGMDAVVVVEPFYTPQIAKTVLAGHNPGAMAVSGTSEAGYLFVANPKSGDVSILDIVTKNVVAVTPVGTEPSYITITPDDQYALVLNQVSGDMAVIRIPNVTRTVEQWRREKKGALFMLIPVGSRPVSAAIVGI